MSIQSINNTIQRMGKMGYVKRSKDEQDKRFSNLRLTKKGKKKFESFRSDQIKAMDSILDMLEASGKKLLDAVSETLAVILGKASRSLMEINHNKIKKSKSR